MKGKSYGFQQMHYGSLEVNPHSEEHQNPDNLVIHKLLKRLRHLRKTSHFLFLSTPVGIFLKGVQMLQKSNPSYS